MCRLRNIAMRVWQTDRQTDRQTDGQTDRQTDGQTTDKVIPMCRYVSLCFAGDTKIKRFQYVHNNTISLVASLRKEFVRRHQSSPGGNRHQLEYWQSQEGPRRALCKFAGAMLKFLKSRSKVTVKVTRSKFMVPLERPCHKEHTCEIWKFYLIG